MTLKELAENMVEATRIYISFFKKTPDMTNESDVKELLCILEDVNYLKHNIKNRQE